MDKETSEALRELKEEATIEEIKPVNYTEVIERFLEIRKEKGKPDLKNKQHLAEQITTCNLNDFENESPKLQAGLMSLKRDWKTLSSLMKEYINNLFPEEEKIEEDPIFTEDFLYYKQNAKGEDTGEPKVSIDKLANHLIDKFNFKTIHGKKEELIYLYDKGIYVLKGRAKVKTESEKILNNYCYLNTSREILEKVKNKTEIDFEDFDITPINLIPLENGVYNLEKEELENYKPELYFKFKIPVEHNKEKSCPTFLKFLDEILYPDDIPVIQEWFGFCLYRRYIIKKACIWFGDGNTGKTTLMTILEGLFGLKNCSGLSLQNISISDKFGLASLHNKHLNSYDDLSSKDVSDGGGFKIATGKGSITAEHKFGDSFKFFNFSKLLFACNKIPPLKDIDDPAYWDRWLPIAFDNIVTKDKIDLEMDKKCLKEKSGILNWALLGLKRLLENKEFSFYKTPEEIKNIMCASGKPLYSFVQDVLTKEEGATITKDQMYLIYKYYADEKDLTPLSKEQLGRQLKLIEPYITSGVGKDGRFWKNVKITATYDFKDKIKAILEGGNKTL